MNRALPSVLAAAGAGVLLYWGLSRRLIPEEPPQPPTPAAEFKLPDLDGRPRTLAELRGTPPKVVLLDFWATWCIPCIEELPDLKKLHADFKDRGFTMVGIAVDEEGKEAVAPFVKENAVSYPVLLTPTLLADYRIPGIPTAFLIDRAGLIVKTYYGPKSYDMLAHDLEPLLRSER